MRDEAQEMWFRGKGLSFGILILLLRVRIDYACQAIMSMSGCPGKGFGFWCSSIWGLSDISHWHAPGKDIPVGISALSP